MKYPKAGDLQRATSVQLTSNPCGCDSGDVKRNPYEVSSASGLEGVFAQKDDAEAYAQEIRESGARDVTVGRRDKATRPRPPKHALRNPAYVGFHGSTRPIKDPTKMPLGVGDFGAGMYFSTSEVDAGRYGFDTYRSSINLDRPLVVPSEMTPELDRIRKAFRIDDEYMESFDEGAWHGIVGLVNSVYEAKTFIATMRKLGYDGIVIPNEIVRQSRGNRNAKGDYIVIFGFDSIKSWEPAFATLEEWKVAYRASQPGQNPGPRVLREKWGDSSDIVIESNRYGYTGWLESKRGGGRHPISFGEKRPETMREAMELAKKFLNRVYGKSNPARMSNPPNVLPVPGQVIRSWDHGDGRLVRICEEGTDGRYTATIKLASGLDVTVPLTRTEYDLRPRKVLERRTGFSRHEQFIGAPQPDRMPKGTPDIAFEDTAIARAAPRGPMEYDEDRQEWVPTRHRIIPRRR